MNNASRTEKRNRKLISQGIIAKRIHKESFKSLKQVIALEGYHDDGKTSVIKTLIGELYRRDPKSWKGSRKFNPDKVKITGSKYESEYSAVFCYRGVMIAIYTGGDNPSVNAGSFEFFARHHAVIGITAVKVEVEGKTTLAATAYAQAESIIGFKSTKISIRGKLLREEKQEMVIVKEIIASLDAIVDNLKGVL